MIDYETYCRIIHLNQRGLQPPQIAHQLGVDVRTVTHWIEAGNYRPRQSARRASKLDRYKPQIARWLEQRPLPIKS